MGEKSFGKGSVQTVVPLSDGSAVRITTSKYFTPNDRSIHGEGIEPDIVVEYNKERSEEKEDAEPDVFEELLNEEEDSEQRKEVEAKKKEYDNQVLSAVDVLKGIIIYNET